MSQPGIGVMIHALSGGSPRSPSDFYGRKIMAAEITDDVLRLTFANGGGIKIWDDGQSCCEHRYMTCDDDLSKLVGDELRRIEVKKVEDKDRDGESHEIAFLEIGTDQCFVTVCTHNEHNGHYGGFGLSIDEVNP